MNGAQTMIQPKHVSHEDIDERLARGEGRFREIEDKLDNLIEGVAKLTATVEPIRDDISTIKEMTGGWKAIGQIGRFFKWVSGVGAGVAIVAAAIVVVVKAAVIGDSLK